MSYHPHTMLPEDVRDYAAPRGWWYENRDKVVGVGCALLFVYYLLSPSAAHDVKFPVGPTPATATHAAASGLCLRYQDGLPLRGMIEHQYEGGFKEHRCRYGKIYRRDWQ